MDIKEALKNGATAEELIQSFKDQVEEAKEEILEEENIHLGIAREEFVKAMINYIEELGLFDEETDETIEKARVETENYLRKIEKTVKNIFDWENYIRMYEDMLFSKEKKKKNTEVIDSISELKRMINELK